MAQSVGDLYYEVTLELRNLIDAQRQLDRRLSGMEGRAEQFSAKFKTVAAAITAALSAIAIEGLVSKIITAQRQFDVLFASLKTMTGGMDQASAAWEKLVAFAATTPYSLEQAVQAFTKLKALGLDPSERAMTSYGNTAAAMGKDLMQMIEAVADAATGEFERLKEFGIKAKQQGDMVALTFQGVTTKIKNDSDAITEYLIKIGEVQFGGAMADRIKTLDGEISALEDSMNALYLSISKSGFGDVISSSVRKATEAIQEATTSIKEGGLTEYFDAIKPYVVAAEVAVVSLAGAITGKLVAALAESAVKAYAAAAATGVAATAAGGFSAALALMGGPIGIAITALALIAMNWDKISISAQNAAQISENAAARIAGAQKKTASRATADLQGQLDEAQKNLTKTERDLAAASKKSIYGGTASPKKDIEELEARRDAYVQAASDIKKAMNGLGGGGGRGSVNPELVRPQKQGADVGDWMDKYATKAEKLNEELKKAKDELGEKFTPELESRIREKFAEKKGGGGAAKAERQDLGAQSYYEGLVSENKTGLEKIDAEERKALAENAKRRVGDVANADAYEKAKVEIVKKYAKERALLEEQTTQQVADLNIQITTDEATKIEAVRSEAFRRADAAERLGTMSHDEAERAKTLASFTAAQQRQIITEKLTQTITETNIEATENELTKIDLMRQESLRRTDAAVRAGVMTFAQGEADKARAAADAQRSIREKVMSINPLAALTQEYEQKLAIVQYYEQQMAQAGVDATAFAEGKRAELSRQYQAQRQAIAESEFAAQGAANQFLMDSFNAMSSTATSAIMGLINGTMTAQDAMRNLAGVILNEAVGSLVQIGVQYIKNALIGQAAEKALMATKAANAAMYTAAVAAQVGVTSSLAAAAAFASTAAIPIIGPGLAPAAAAAAGTMAAALGAPAIAAAPIAGARQYGGPVSANSMYRVNEKGAPEMFTAGNGSQYMLPTASGRVTAADQVGGGGAVQWNIIVNNSAPGVAVTASVDDQSRTVTLAVGEVASQIRANSGPVWSALRSSTSVQGKM